VATLEDGTLAEPACSALAEYRWATFRLEVLFFFAGYWQAIAASAAAGGGGRSAQEEERLMLEGLVAEIELRHGVAVGSFAAVGPRRGQRVHVLDPYWTRDWAVEELAGRRLPASLEQLEEESRTTRTTRLGSSRSWSSAASIFGRTVRTEWRPRPLRTRSFCGARLSARARVWLMCPCTWVRCCLVFSVLFGGLLGDRE